MSPTDAKALRARIQGLIDETIETRDALISADIEQNLAREGTFRLEHAIRSLACFRSDLQGKPWHFVEDIHALSEK